jgi:hypothetical protein
MIKFAGRYLLGIALLSGVGTSAIGQPEALQNPSRVRSAYKEPIDAENFHDLNSVSALVLESQDTLFEAKAPVGWKGCWGKDDVMQHLHDLYQHPFRIDLAFAKEKLAFLAPGFAETYVPVHFAPVYETVTSPAPFIMVLLWLVRTENGKWQPIFRYPYLPRPTNTRQVRNTSSPEENMADA